MKIAYNTLPENGYGGFMEGEQGPNEVVPGAAEAAEMVENEMSNDDALDLEQESEEYSEDGEEVGQEEDVEVKAEVIDQAQKEGKISKKEAQQLKKKLKLKVDGQEIEEEIDWNDDAKLQKMLQKAYAADGRMQEAAKLKKQVEDLYNFINENPEEALRQLGKDPEKLAESIIERKLKELEMSPEEKEKQELQKRIEKYEKEIKEREEREKQLYFETQRKEYATQLDQKITSALEQNKDLPKSSYVVKRIADALYKYTKAGIPVEVDQLVPAVKTQIKKEISEMFQAMPDEAFESSLGKENLERLKRMRMAKMKKTQKPQPVRRERETSQSVQKEPKKIPMREFFKRLGK